MFILFIPPLASASGGIHVGPMTFVVENGRHSDCVDEACLISMSGGTPGELEINITQDVSNVGLALDRHDINAAFGWELLPDRVIWITPSEREIGHPAFRLMIDTVGTARGPGPLHAFGVVFNESGYGLYYLGPRLQPFDPELAQRNPFLSYGNESDEHGLIERDSIQMNQNFGNSSTDENLRGNVAYPCKYFKSEPCKEAVGEILDVVAAETPNVAYGGGFVRLGVATDPALLSTSAIGPRGPAVAPFMRAPDQDIVGPPQLLAAQTIRDLFTGSPSRSGNHERGPPEQVTVAPKLSIPPFRPPPAPPGPHVPPAFLASAAFALAVLAAALYSRVTKREELLLRARRADLLRLVEERGPLPIVEAARALALDRTTVCYHARMLARAGRLRVVRRGKSALLALADQRAEPASPACAADRVLAIVRAQGGSVPRRALASLAVDMPKRTLSYALRDLSARGLVERVQREGEPLVRLREPAGAA